MSQPEVITKELWYTVSPQGKDSRPVDYATPDEAVNAAVTALRNGVYSVYLFRTERLHDANTNGG